VQTAQTWTYSSPHTNEHGLRQVLECLREVGALWLPLQVRACWLAGWLADLPDHPVSALLGIVLASGQMSQAACMITVMPAGLPQLRAG
jgi:hypothetical protein